MVNEFKLTVSMFHAQTRWTKNSGKSGLGRGPLVRWAVAGPGLLGRLLLLAKPVPTLEKRNYIIFTVAFPFLTQ